MSQALADESLALLLQAAQDFAFGQLAHGKRLIPFAARVVPDGEIDFIRFAQEDTDLALDTIYQQTQATLAGDAQSGALLAAATVAAVSADEELLGEGFTTAMRVHVEAQGYSRVVFSPYRIDGEAAGEAQIVLGKLVAIEADGAIFAA